MVDMDVNIMYQIDYTPCVYVCAFVCISGRMSSVMINNFKYNQRTVIYVMNLYVKYGHFWAFLHPEQAECMLEVYPQRTLPTHIWAPQNP